MATIDLAQQPGVRVYDGWNHQLEAYSFVQDRPAAMLAMAMGTGKSWVAVSQVNNQPGFRRGLILCPVSVLAVWRREFLKHSPEGGGPAVLILDDRCGSVADKTKRADEFLKLASLRGQPAVIVINYESAWREPFGEWARGQLWDLAALDESHRIKSPSGKASRFADKLRPQCGKRLELTGTPMPHSPLDVFAQYRFLDPNVFGRHFVQFRGRYAHTDRMFPSKVLKWLNQDELHEKFYTLAYRVGAEVLDLPPVLNEQRSFKLSPNAWGIYRDLRDELIAQVASGVVVADNALVKLLRLQQVTGGTIANSEGEVTAVDDGKEKLLADLLSDLPADEPVVCFCRFRADLAAVERVALAGGRRYGELSGRRKDLTEHATMPPDIDLFGVQWQSGGVGIDLTRAAYCVMYSGTWSLGDFDQAMARVHRPGQTRTTTYYHLTAENTVDELIYKALEARREIVAAVLLGLTDEHSR